MSVSEGRENIKGGSRYGGRRKESEIDRDSHIISFTTIKEFDQYVAVWFADVASRYLLGIPIHEVSYEHLSQLYREADRLLRELGQKGIDVSRPPIPLTANDDPGLLNPRQALELLRQAAEGQILIRYPLPPALSFEFAEYVRAFMPRVKDSTKKIRVVYIESPMIALSILGALISRAYVLEGGEYGYVFVNTFNPAIVDTVAMNEAARRVAQAVSLGQGSRLALLVGISAAIASEVRGKLFDDDGRTMYSSVRIMMTGRKSLLKSFETIDLTDLAKTIWTLGMSEAVLSLVERYPRPDEVERDKGARVLRSFIEELSKAIYVYHSYGDATELYRVYRSALTGESALRNAIESYFSKRAREVWDRMLSKLLSVKCL